MLLVFGLVPGFRRPGALQPLLLKGVSSTTEREKGGKEKKRKKKKKKKTLLLAYFLSYDLYYPPSKFLLLSPSGLFSS